MNKILRKFFGCELVRSKKIPDFAKAAKAVVERDDLKEEVRKLREELDTKIAKYPVVDINVGDPAPKDKEDRALYVAAVAGFHKNYLKPKISQMISTSNDLLNEIANERDLDLVLKGSVYCLKEFDRWGDAMISEQVGNQVGVNPASEKD